MSHIILIHGAWGSAWVYDSVAKNLRSRGHTVSTLDLPGHGNNPKPINEVTINAYVDHVVDYIRDLNEPVILGGHSLGGAVISLVAERIPSAIDRLLYICAMLPKDGDTPLGIMQNDPGGILLPKIEFSEDGTYATVSDEAVSDVFLHDVKDKEQLEEMLPHFRIKQATEPFASPITLTKEAFGSVSKFYFRAEFDRVLSIDVQDQMIKNWEVDAVSTLQTGHFPLLSTPTELANHIHNAAETKLTHA